MLAHIFTGLPIKSTDGDIQITLATFYYYEGLARRVAFANYVQPYLMNALQISAAKYGPIIENLLNLWGEKLF